MTGEIITCIDGKAGRIRLNRPGQLHALNHTMCDAMLRALDDWENDPAIDAILIDHNEGRGFCAGGDIRMLAASAESDGAEARAFFFTEYQLNHRLFTFPKPIVAFMDGVTMGGGVGISQPCRFRVATENTRFAMPETSIGLFPDVGGGWYLSRLPGRMGEYLALTGHRLNGAEAIALGLATHYLTCDVQKQAKAAIAATPAQLESILNSFCSVSPVAAIVQRSSMIDHLFKSDRLEDIFAALGADDSEFARETLAVLRTKSPYSMKVSLELLRQSRTLATFEDEMRLEYVVASHVVLHRDFREGVRAVIIEKDNAPRWSAATPEDVDDRMISETFAPVPPAEAWLPA